MALLKGAAHLRLLFLWQLVIAVEEVKVVLNSNLQVFDDARSDASPENHVRCSAESSACYYIPVTVRPAGPTAGNLNKHAEAKFVFHDLYSPVLTDCALAASPVIRTDL